MLFCLQGLLARLSQHEFHLGRDWPLEFFWKVCVPVRGSRARKKLFPRNVTKTTSTAENTKEYPKWKLLLPTSNRHLQGYFWIFNLPGVFYFGNGADSQAPSCTKFGPRSWFFISVTFLGGFARMAKEHGQFLHVIQVNTLNPFSRLVNIFYKILILKCFVMTRVIEELFSNFLSIFISVFLWKLHKTNANHPDPPWNQQKSHHHCHEAKPRGPSPLF